MFHDHCRGERDSDHLHPFRLALNRVDDSDDASDAAAKDAENPVPGAQILIIGTVLFGRLQLQLRVENSVAKTALGGSNDDHFAAFGAGPPRDPRPSPRVKGELRTLDVVKPIAPRGGHGFRAEGRGTLCRRPTGFPGICVTSGTIMIWPQAGHLAFFPELEFGADKFLPHDGQLMVIGTMRVLL